MATDNGIMHKLRAAAPGKQFIEAPTGCKSATCKSCAHYPWMAMNGLQNLADSLERLTGEVRVEPIVGELAQKPIQRMLDFAAAKNVALRPGPKLENEQSLFWDVGPA